MGRLSLLLLLLASVPAQAGLSEIRLGVFDHDIGFLGHDKEGGADINAEALFDSPDFLKAIWAPRPHMGASVNTQGDTSQLYAGLTWTYEPIQKVFMDFSFGGSVHNGELNTREMDRKSLGSRVLFRESLSLGYRIDDHHSVSIAFDHESNANLASHNAGLNNLGIRWGYRF
ncbi:MAG: acyloxyacyl hydrolase [Rhodospirillaceae bacterium]|nr:acyloxyacyl hydrolase [Rhodospirillales bacterium]